MGCIGIVQVAAGTALFAAPTGEYPMDLSNLRRKRDFYTNNSPAWVRIVFRSFTSFNWFCKDNRNALIAAGALFRIGRDYFVDTEIFVNTLIELRGIPVTGRVLAPMQMSVSQT